MNLCKQKNFRVEQIFEKSNVVFNHFRHGELPLKKLRTEIIENKTTKSTKNVDFLTSKRNVRVFPGKYIYLESYVTKVQEDTTILGSCKITRHSGLQSPSTFALVNPDTAFSTEVSQEVSSSTIADCLMKQA